MPKTQVKALLRWRFVSSLFIYSPAWTSLSTTKNLFIVSKRVRQRFGIISSSQVNQKAERDMLVVRSLLDQNGVRTFFKKNVTSLLVYQNDFQVASPLT